jgi:hypothetical protein
VVYWIERVWSTKGRARRPILLRVNLEAISCCICQLNHLAPMDGRNLTVDEVLRGRMLDRSADWNLELESKVERALT